MFRIMDEEKEAQVKSKEDVIKSIEAIINRHERGDYFCKIEHFDFTLEIWLIHEKKQCVLFYIPKDEREDCKISCCGDKEKIDKLTISVTIGESAISCSEYNMISSQAALNNIKDLLWEKETIQNDNWTCW